MASYVRVSAVVDTVPGVSDELGFEQWIFLQDA